MKLCNLLLAFLLSLCCSVSSDTYAQSASLIDSTLPKLIRVPAVVPNQYPFINFDKNQFEFFTDRSANFEWLYSQLDSMIRRKDRKLNFYHIGGSHIQADIYSNDIRMFLQTNFDGLPGERGSVYPFNLAGTNNPSNYRFTSSNNFRGKRIVGAKDHENEFGLHGTVLLSTDSVVNVHFYHKNTFSKPGFNKVRIFHNKGKLPFDINFGSDEILITSIREDVALGLSEICFSDKLDSLDIQFTRIINQRWELELYGFQFLNDDPGISYTSIGVNGAGLYSYLDCARFEEQLKVHPPDFFAFSVGTNDANVPYDRFRPEVYKSNLEKMMKIVLRANPKCAILLTVPNDAYYYKKSPNRNVARQREVIIELAKEYELAVWDFYGIMGELGSSKLWQRNGLMNSDLVHFTSAGYHLKGDLFIDAFLKFMRQMQLLTPIN